MKYTHKSEILDDLLHKHVIVDFQDGSQARGTLIYASRPDYRRNMRAGFYYVITKTGYSIAFRKTHIKRIVEQKSGEKL